MRVNIVVPPFAQDRYSGGIWCVMQHAQQLALRGHAVTVVPSHPSPEPSWVPKPWRFELLATRPRHAILRALRSFGASCVSAFDMKLRGATVPTAAQERRIRNGVGDLTLALGNYGRHGARMGSAVDHLARTLPAADLTLATDAETAWPVSLTGRGRLAYFAQHFEPYFWKERLGGEASRREAELSYGLGLHPIANSSWLRDLLQARLGKPVSLAPNAIDHDTYRGAATPRRATEPLRVISYGGRGAEWKGFAEMCEAVRLTRAQGVTVEWSVFGTALLPPDNPVAAYRPLGFLGPEALATAYRANHVLLSASWYESFPLFPIEAMASGLAVITTRPGTEEFAVDGQTAIVVPPRDPALLAAALLRLESDEPLRYRLAIAGTEASQRFTWAGAGKAMEAALLNVIGSVADPPPT